MWQHLHLCEQIRPRDTLACCWDVKQLTSKPTLFTSFSFLPSVSEIMVLMTSVDSTAYHSCPHHWHSYAPGLTEDHFISLIECAHDIYGHSVSVGNLPFLYWTPAQWNQPCLEIWGVCLHVPRSCRFPPVLLCFLLLPLSLCFIAFTSIPPPLLPINCHSPFQQVTEGGMWLPVWWPNSQGHKMNTNTQNVTNTDCRSVMCCRGGASRSMCLL